MMRIVGRRRHVAPDEVGPARSLRELVDHAKESLADDASWLPTLHVSNAEGSATYLLPPGDPDTRRVVDDLTRRAGCFVLVELRRAADGVETVHLRAQQGRKKLLWTAPLAAQGSGRTVRPPDWVRVP
jgi:hypothetical protein